MRTPSVTHLGFDLDHTLCDYALSTREVIAVALDRCALSEEALGPTDALAQRYDALWWEWEQETPSIEALRLRIWTRLLEERGRPDDASAACIAAEYGAVRRESGVRLLSGVRDTLTALRSRGLPLGLLTNGPSELQWPKLHQLGLIPFLDAVVVAGDIGLYKPDRRAFLALLDRLSAPAESTLFVGDSYEADVLGADGAGLLTAWVRPEGTPLPGCVIPTASLVSVANLQEVLS